jgi:hypothetical protein
METSEEERRLLAVLALLRGEPAAQVCRQYSICRSDLYNSGAVRSLPCGRP